MMLIYNYAGNSFDADSNYIADYGFAGCMVILIIVDWGYKPTNTSRDFDGPWS